MKQIVFLSFMAYGVAALPAAGSDDAPPKPVISNRAYTGNGCPAGTVSSSTSPMDPNTGFLYLTHAFDKLMPFTGPGTSVKDHTKKCEITFNMTVPEGWKLRVNQNGTVFGGYLQIFPQDTAVVRVEYVVSRENPSSISEARIKGPLNNRVPYQTAKPINGSHVSLCGGGTLNSTFRLSTTNSGSKDWSWLDDPEDYEMIWTFQTPVEVVKC